MGRFYGVVGYGVTEETAPSVYETKIVERKYFGEYIKKYARWDANSESINDNLTVNADISIIADAFAYDKFSDIRYVEYMGTKWKVTMVSVERPRLVLTLGGVYNE